MNLSEMLGYADIGQLSRIADVYRCECNSHSKNELIQSILRAISNKEGFKNQISSMTWEEKRFLNSLLFDSQNAFSLEELIARVQQSRFDTGPQESKAVQAPEKRDTAAAKKNKKKQAGHNQSGAAQSP